MPVAGQKVEVDLYTSIWSDPTKLTKAFNLGAKSASVQTARQVYGTPYKQKRTSVIWRDFNLVSCHEKITARGQVMNYAVGGGNIMSSVVKS
jgi:hypothetical protein